MTQRYVEKTGDRGGQGSFSGVKPRTIRSWEAHGEQHS